MIVYFNGDYLPEGEVHISPNDRGMMFADGVYEVVRSYRGLLFRLDAHLARLEHSLAALRIRFDGLAALPEVFRELMRRNEMSRSDALVYLQITRGVYPRTHAFPPAEVKPTVYARLSEPHVAEGEPDGVEVILVGDTRWARCDIKSLALLPNVLAAEEARERGAREALFVRDGMVIEGSRSNFAAIRSGVFVTPPESNYMLAGISRGVVLELCDKLSIPVELRPIPERELLEFDELLLIGTSAEVLPVVSVDGKPVGNGVAGPFAHRLRAAFDEEVEENRRR